MDLICCVLVLVVLGLLGALKWRLFQSAESRRIDEYLDKLPGPPTYPIIGSMRDFIGTTREQFYDIVISRNEKYGPIFKVWVGSLPTVMVTQADYFEKIMSSQEHIFKTTVYDYVRPWLGDGLVLSGGPKWRKHRRLLTPAFHFKILEQFVEVFAERANDMIEAVAGKVGVQFDMYPYITNCALNSICETSMGVQLNALPGNTSKYAEAVHSINEQVIQRITRPWLKNDFLYGLTELGREFKKTLNTLHTFTNDVIEQRKATMLKSTSKGDELTEEEKLMGKKRRLAFLDILLEADNTADGKLTQDEIRQEVDTFMFAGHDTITAMTCWALILLGSHPEIQEKAREEIDAVFPEDRQLTLSDLNEMKYLERVIKETLRLYPSAPTIGRLLKEDLILGDHLIPAGVSVFMHLNHAHRNPEYYEEPEKFEPDRFLPENSKNRHPYAFVPFSAGPRNCLGQRYAMYKGKTMLATILKHYRVKAIEDHKTIKIYKEIVMKPQNGLQVILEKIK